jgi:hypothetical protein
MFIRARGRLKGEHTLPELPREGDELAVLESELGQLKVLVYTYVYVFVRARVCACVYVRACCIRPAEHMCA